MSLADKNLTIRLQWIFSILFLIQRIKGLESMRCGFNSMCTCSYESGTQQIDDISCVAVVFYKYPNVPEVSITHMEVQGTNIVSLESLSLAGIQIQSLTIANNKLRRISEKAFSSTNKILSSLDLSYNELDSIPYNALRELRNLQWLNLHGNAIHSLVGDWSHLKNTVANLFLGGNDISELPSDAEHMPRTHGLRHFKTLIWLNLDSNRISRVHKHSLPTGLQTLSISQNLLETFPIEVLTTLPHLQWLYLRGNYITHLPEHTLPRRLRLEKIDLSENSLKSLPRNPFNNSVFVRDLNLAFNNLKYLSAESFQGLKCGRIIMSYNQIESLDRKALHGLQDSLEYLDLDHNNLMHVPHALHHVTQLKYLYLSANQISEIPEHAFQAICSNLKALSLSGNRLIAIPLEALLNCSNVSYFNIGYNEIYEISEADFEWAINVKTLLLRNNRLTHLKERTFISLRELKELSLSFNPLRYVDALAFEGLGDLDSLEISFGFDRDDFPQDILKPFINLQWLTLDNNNFRTISERALLALGQLRYLNLESNRIDVIPVNLFRDSAHQHLRDIRFSNNELQIIRSETFSSLNSLQIIMLLGNRIKLLQKNSFHNLTNLTTLILSNNIISVIASESFSDLPVLSRLDLQSNRLSELSFKMFANVSIISPMFLNVSRNSITSCQADSKIVSIEVFDLKYNNLEHIPRCLESVSALRKLYLDFNAILSLGHNNFMHLTSLEILTLNNNNIQYIHKHSFFGLQNLQILNLAVNQISQLHISQFSAMPRLRILNLSHNRIKYLPKDILSGTVVEMLDLSFNTFNVIPSISLIEIGSTLRHLLVNANNIEHVDSTTFPDIPFLQQLDLSNNKLTILPDNVFTSLGLLQKLDLSFNNLRANFKELFHYAQSLKELHLCNSGILSTPHLPLPNLVYLNLSMNHIHSISKASLQDLLKLRYLFLNNNKLSTIPSHVWSHMPLLKTLDLSNNPIKEIVMDSFHGLHNLQHLHIQGLQHLKRFESKALMQLKLSTLVINTWPSLENFKPQFCLLLANLTKLKILRIYFEESILDDQITCLSSRKIKTLQITGQNLKHIDRDAFVKLTQNSELLIQITDTQVEELPAGLFTNVDKISHLSIDLRNNLLTYLSPDIFYANATTWKNVGTTLVAGGLIVSNNPWKCGCHLTWLSHWLRRWARESLQSHTAPVDTSIRLNELVKEATCAEMRSGGDIPIVQLSPEDMSCHASALSRAAYNQRTSVLIAVVVYIFITNRFIIYSAV